MTADTTKKYGNILANFVVLFNLRWKSVLKWVFTYNLASLPLESTQIIAYLISQDSGSAGANYAL